MPDSGSAPNAGITSDERIRNTLRRHIRKALDRRDFDRKSLSSESGVNVCHIDGILSHDGGKHRRVATEDAFNLAYTLGEGAVEALVGCIHYTARKAGDGDDALPGMIVANGLQAFSTIASAAADGRFDHTEMPACREAADALIATVLPLSSAGQVQ